MPSAHADGADGGDRGDRADRRGVLVPGLPAAEVRRLMHRANVAVARAAPGEQPYVVGWDLVAADAGPVAILDVEDDPRHLTTWLACFPSATVVPAPAGDVLPWPVEEHRVRLPLDEGSVQAQRRRDGRVDRFHVAPQAAEEFGVEARAFVGDDAVFYGLESAGVRTFWPTSPLEGPLTQTLDDVAAGYGGPVGYAVTAVDDQGWRRVTVEALGQVTFTRWEAPP